VVGALTRRFESLAARIVLATFAATLVTSLVVTWTSMQSTEGFLREKIDQKFPAILRSANERLEIGYSQRQLEVETFARSATVMESFAHLADRAARGADAARLEDARVYLSYVLERFPEFQALFVLDTRGDVLVWAGARLELPEAVRVRLASVREPSVAGMERLHERRFQMASSPIRDARGRRVATLHALVGMEALEADLPVEDLSAEGAIYVVGSDGKTLLRSRGAFPRDRYDGPRPQPGQPPAVAEYTNDAGERVVVGALAFSRFGWTLVVEETYAEAFAPVVALVRKTFRVNLLIVLTFGVIAFQVARSIVRPIVALSKGARRIADGEPGVELPVSNRNDEIGVLTRAIGEMTGRLHANQLELQEKQREIERANQRLAAHNVQLQQVNEVLEQLSITDGLTRLHNHRFFQDHLPREVKRASRTGEPLSLLLIDIDDFKQFNDRYGHAAGDVALRRAAEVMSGLVRDMDLLSRYGGEEFALLASQTDLEGAMTLAEKIRAAIEKTRFEVEDRGGTRQVHLTVSIGVAPYKGDRKAFFNDADSALYRAKRAGKNCIEAAIGPG
jgi:diguanylate cyclase (GGDEF)-like protein